MTEPRSGAREWRLYIIAAIAGVYVLAWSRIAPAPHTQVAEPTTRSIWLDELPRADRPLVSPPAGWRVVDRRDVATPIPRRVPPPRTVRVRTRSS